MFPARATTISTDLRSVCVVDKSCADPLVAVVRDGSVDVGAVFYSPANDGEILGMGTLPAYWRRGIARKLWLFVAHEAGVASTDVVAEPVTKEGLALCAAMWRK